MSLRVGWIIIRPSYYLPHLLPLASDPKRSGPITAECPDPTGFSGFACFHLKAIVGEACFRLSNAASL